MATTTTKPDVRAEARAHVEELDRQEHERRVEAVAAELRERQEAEAREQAVRDHEEALKRQLAPLDVECRSLALAADKRLAAAARDVKAYVETSARRQTLRTELQVARGEAVVGNGGTPGPLIERAFMFHLIESGPGRVVSFDSKGSGDFRPLAGFEPASETQGE